MLEILENLVWQRGIKVGWDFEKALVPPERSRFRRLNRYQAGDRFPSLCNHDFLTGQNASEESREMGLGFVNTHFGHESNINLVISLVK